MDGNGLCILANRLEKGRFIWPKASNGCVTIIPSTAFNKHTYEKLISKREAVRLSGELDELLPLRCTGQLAPA